MSSGRLHILIGTAVLLCAGTASAQSGEQGIPVTNPVVIAKCGSCHAADAHGVMQRISFGRTTPEGWQAVVKDMILVRNLSVTPEEARTIVKYLSTAQGLAPEEARPVMFEVERRVHDETGITESLRRACARCHNMARALSWHRSADEWKQFLSSHAETYKVKPNDVTEALTLLTSAAPLHTPAWDSRNSHGADLAGGWLLTASMPGHGSFYGDMQVERTGEDEYSARVHMTSLRDGSTVVRTGKIAAYGTAWRGRSSGIDQPAAGQAFANLASVAPDDAASDAREVLQLGPDATTGEGRWFWGRYDEFGFDVHIRRAESPTSPALLLVDRPSLRIGSTGNRVRIVAENLPPGLTAADLTIGPGVTARNIVSSRPNEVVAEFDVSAGVQPGKRDVVVRGAPPLREAISLYDRIDYLKVTPESAVASFGDRTHPRGYQQFEAVAYSRGPDGKVHTDDDLELGPVDAAWVLQVFHTPQGGSSDFAGAMNPFGLLTPAAVNPNNNFDAWVIATAKTEKNAAGEPLTGKAYVVIAIPTYAINGRLYARDLNRWVDDGPAPPGAGQNGKPVTTPGRGRGGRGGGPAAQ